MTQKFISKADLAAIREHASEETLGVLDYVDHLVSTIIKYDLFIRAMIDVMDVDPADSEIGVTVAKDGNEETIVKVPLSEVIADVEEILQDRQ